MGGCDGDEVVQEKDSRRHVYFLENHDYVFLWIRGLVWFSNITYLDFGIYFRG